MSEPKKIVIIGGGAGGLELATRLGNNLGKTSLAEIILVDQNLSYIWKPLWHEIAAGGLDVSKNKIEYLAHGNEHGFKFKLGHLIRLNRDIKEVSLGQIDSIGNTSIPESTISYDILILAVGSVHNDFGTPGADIFCLSFDSVRECNIFHDCLIVKLLELAQTNKKELDFAIIGGGSTGVELAFEANNTITKLLEYKSLLNNNIKVNLSIIESGPTILSNLPGEIIKDTVELLEAAQVKIYSGERVIKIDADSVYTESRQIKADIKLWAAGIKAPSFMTTLGLSTNERNQLLLRDTLQVTDNDHIFAIGDCANFKERERSLPPTAQLAHQQAKFLAQSLIKYIKYGTPLAKFTFKKQGTIISVGSSGAVGEIETAVLGKVKLNKKIAYISYRFLYRGYQAALYGWTKVVLLLLADFLARRVRPKIKLH